MIGPHRILEGAEEAAVIEDLRARIPHMAKASGQIDRWEDGWAENLHAFKQSGDITSLRPKYIRGHQPLRLNGKFVIAEDPDAEMDWYRQFFEQLAEQWLEPYENIWEFGFGSGHNLAWLQQRYLAKLRGFERAASSLQILEQLGIPGESFDFCAPSPPIQMPSSTAIFTVGALEQTGLLWRPFLNWLIAARPALCMMIEPVVEWYDPANPVDATAIEAHAARGFWRGFPDELEKLKASGTIEILKMQRTGLGSLAIEGYNQMIWRPL